MTNKMQFICIFDLCAFRVTSQSSIFGFLSIAVVTFYHVTFILQCLKQAVNGCRGYFTLTLLIALSAVIPQKPV